MKIARGTADRVKARAQKRSGARGIVNGKRGRAWVSPSEERLVANAFRRVEHDRRRCTGRNTIISAVNKFLNGTLLSLSCPTKSSCLQISKYCFLATFQVYATENNGERDLRDIKKKSEGKYLQQCPPPLLGLASNKRGMNAFRDSSFHSRPHVALENYFSL
ncbi:hypothetical protein PUN28_004608 [Cardiocondyla obscurior]|uniref:Uncharacterized protein n=1 Tax=Cardiocondyla obscurior TaxID=286306 RepID=A0AAW2GHR3_9HYME